MKRSPIARRAPLRAKAPAKAERAPVPAYRLTRSPSYAACTVAVPVPKLATVRSESYRRLVAARPCIACGAAGLSNHAHANTGKGMGLKVCDLLAFPLCVDQPGRRGCHSIFDQGAMFDKLDRRAMELQWARATLQAIIAEGKLPRGLPVPEWASC